MQERIFDEYMIYERELNSQAGIVSVLVMNII
jgi:hypothetical protein